MLSSIHPLGERTRTNRWLTTVSAHVLGAGVGGAVSGTCAGALGAALARADLAPRARVLLVVPIAISATIVDARGWPRWANKPRRQVDERWLTTYRGWVYGVGYGLQLGFGAVTIISAATLYALAAAIVAIASVPVGALIGAVFGLARGATLFMARSVDSPSDLMAFHRRLASRRAVGVWSAITGDVAIAIGAGLAAFGAVR